jgi:hypothetical protein
MSNRSGKLLSTFFIASFAGSVLAITANSPARADDTCLAGPKATTPRGSHWYYRVEPGTKRHCWYLGEGRGKTTQRAAAKPSSPPPAPDKPAQTSAAPPLQPAVADARAEFDEGARNQANAGASVFDADSSNLHDKASTASSPADTTLPAEATPAADARPSADTPRWPDPAINTAPTINAAQQPVPAAAVTPGPQLQNDRPAPVAVAAAAPAPQLLGERSEAGPAVGVVGASSESSSYSMPLLLGGLGGALAFAGLLGFAVVKFGSLSSLTHIRRRSESIWDAVDTGHLPPWQQPNSDIRPPHLRDPLRARREIEAQSRDIMEILSRASRGATT